MYINVPGIDDREMHAALYKSLYSSNIPSYTHRLNWIFSMGEDGSVKAPPPRKADFYLVVVVAR